MQNQEKKLWELKKWSPGKKCFDLFSNSLHLFLKYGDQSGEFVREHWDLRIKMLSREKYCLIVYLFFCTSFSMLVIDDNYSFFLFLAEKKALLSQVRSTESFLDKFVMYFCFSATFSQQTVSEFPTPTFPWIYLSCSANWGRASSVGRALACRAWVCWFISWSHNYIQGQETTEEWRYCLCPANG